MLGQDRLVKGVCAFAPEDQSILEQACQPRTPWYARQNRTYGTVVVFPGSRRMNRQEQQDPDFVLFFDFDGGIHTCRATSVLLKTRCNEFELGHARAWAQDYTRFHALPQALEVSGDCPTWRRMRSPA